eukprot:TRINITY_DN17496_c0_g1_i1.p1 TRINITY_DN17496_c0_g1~~TRINITY_DN17496_c0_g1_i1.p1  ORF type:complete len:294 (-),score=49.20 TRINITY_DN17496_c0_g1_i1:342-1223(-)
MSDLQARAPVACEQRFRLTKMCTFHSAGKCKRGAACSFAHDPKDVLPKLDLYKTSPCMFFFQRGTCRNGKACRFAHSHRELRGNSSPHALEPDGQEMPSSQDPSVVPGSKREHLKVKQKSLASRPPVGIAAQNLPRKGGPLQVLTPDAEETNVEATSKTATTFRPLWKQGQAQDLEKQALDQKEVSVFEVTKGDTISNKPKSYGRTCTRCIEKAFKCAYKPMKVVNLHLNFNGFDRRVQLLACDGTCNHDIASCTDREQGKHIEISVKRTFIEVEVKTSKVIRSMSAPSVRML